MDVDKVKGEIPQARGGTVVPGFGLVSQRGTGGLPRIPLFRVILSAPSAATQCAGVVASAIIVGSSYACALVTNGAIKCWGANSDGQLGTGSTADQTSPAYVDLGSGESRSIGRARASRFVQCSLHDSPFMSPPESRARLGARGCAASKAAVAMLGCGGVERRGTPNFFNFGRL